MFGGKVNVPLTIRMIVGKGWGQGPTHSQSLTPMFCNVPGLKVVMPTFAEDAGRLLYKSIFDPNPVIFLEHRWLHGIKDKDIKKKTWEINLFKCRKKRQRYNNCINVISDTGSLETSKILEKYNIGCEIIDLVSLKPLNINKIVGSLKKTKKDYSY